MSVGSGFPAGEIPVGFGKKQGIAENGEEKK